MSLACFKHEQEPALRPGYTVSVHKVACLYDIIMMDNVPGWAVAGYKGNHRTDPPSSSQGHYFSC